MKKFWNERAVVVAQQCEYTKGYWIVHFQMINYMLCEFHLNQRENERAEL